MPNNQPKFITCIDVLENMPLKNKSILEQIKQILWIVS